MAVISFLPIMQTTRTSLIILSLCLIIVFDSLLSPNFQSSIHDYVRENGNTLFLVDDNNHVLTEEEKAVLLGRNIESLIDELEGTNNDNELQSNYYTRLEVMEEGFGGEDYDLNYVTAQERYIAAAAAASGGGEATASDSGTRSYHSMVNSNLPLPRYNLKDVADSTIVYTGALAIVVYDPASDNFVLSQSGGHPWHEDNDQLNQAFQVVSYMLRELYPKQFQGPGSAEFAMAISVGTFPHVKGTDCVKQSFHEGFEGQPCFDSHFLKAPILHFGNVFAAENMYPNIIPMPKPGVQLGCLAKWAKSKTICEEFSNLIYGDEGQSWDDLSPEVVWRGKDYGYMASVQPGQKLNHGGLRNRINKSLPVWEKEKDLPLAFQEEYSSLASRWRGVLLTIQAINDQKRNWKESLASDEVPWCNIKFLRYGINEEVGYYNQWKSLEKIGLPVIGDKIRQKELTKYKYHIDLGTDISASWGGKLQQLAKPGLLFHHVSPTKDYTHDYMEPWVHYIPVDPKLNDLKAKFDWAEAHPIEAKNIADRGTELAQFFTSFDGFERMFRDEIEVPLQAVMKAYRPLESNRHHKWRKEIDQYYADKILPIMKCSGRTPDRCESLVGKKAFPETNLKRENCQIIYILGVEGANHHGILPIIANLASKQIDPKTGKDYHVAMLPNDLKTGLFGWYRLLFQRKKWKFYEDPGIDDPALAQSVVGHMCPNDGRRHVKVEWASFPSGLIGDKELRGYRVKRQEHWHQLSPEELAEDEFANAHPLDLNAFYDTYSPHAEIKFIVLNRDYTETIASHKDWDGGPEGHSKVLSGFLRIISRFLNSHLDDPITGNKLWTLLCLESIFAKNYQTEAEVIGARSRIIHDLATFLDWPVKDCPDCFGSWHESKKVPEKILGPDNMKILFDHMSALEGVWPPRRTDDALPEQQCGLLTKPATQALALETPAPKPVQIYLLGQQGKKAQSMFYTGHLKRFGTGRIEYNVLGQRADCKISGVVYNDPCLVVNHVSNLKRCSYDDVVLHYPQCKTMLTNDEHCTNSRYDARGYYSSELEDKAYLPLGPRYDSWEAFTALMKQNDYTIVSSSQRKYAFNAMFTKETSVSRSILADVIQTEGDSMSSFVQIANAWHSNPNDPTNKYVDTTTYMQVLLDSTFTLAPAGHNPECFRLYEAVEAGSIPVISLDDEYQTHDCKDSLAHWMDSPIIFVESWTEVMPTLQKLLADPESLDKRQADLRAWYNQYMTNAVRDFETFLLSERYESGNREIIHSSTSKLAPPGVWKTAARACEEPVQLEDIWYKSQSGEDREIETHFQGLCHGRYLEIGGLNGVRFSNSFVYNKGLNWTGVLVEASPKNYWQLIQNRPNEIANVHAGVCEKEMDLHWVEGETSNAVGGFQEFAAPSFQRKWWTDHQVQNAKVVKCRTLEQILLESVGPGFYFDFFSLDVEGAELSVLKSINFDLVGFGLIVVEADEHNPRKNEDVRNLLQSNGYVYLEDKLRSSWFVNKDFNIIYGKALADKME